jgi:ubiquinone/menaquinone biosynthesis C-methylase UbiE
MAKQPTVDSDQTIATQSVLGAREGYDASAPTIRDWYWNAFWRQYEAPFVLGWLAEQCAQSALDVGCGIGTYLEAVCARSRLCIGLDLSWGMLAQAKHLKLQNLALLQADCTALPLSDGSIDMLLCTRVLSNIAQPDNVLQEFARVTSPGAVFLITDVHPLHPYQETHISTHAVDLRIETFKHRVADLYARLVGFGFTDLYVHEWSLTDLNPSPDRNRFAKLFALGNPAVHFALYGRRK